MAKVKFENLRTAVVETTNVCDDLRNYAIKANVNVSYSKNVSSIDSGEVRTLDEDNVIATFNKWGDGNINYSFNNCKAEEQLAIVAAILDFIQSAVDEVKINGVRVEI